MPWKRSQPQFFIPCVPSSIENIGWAFPGATEWCGELIVRAALGDPARPDLKDNCPAKLDD